MPLQVNKKLTKPCNLGTILFPASKSAKHYYINMYNLFAHLLQKRIIEIRPHTSEELRKNFIQENATILKY